MNIKRFLNFRYLFYPFLIFLFGIVVARGLYNGDIETLLIVLISLLTLGIFLIIKKKYKIFAILFSFFFIGNGFYFIGEASFEVKTYDGQVSVTGRVTDDFEENTYYYTVILDDVKINGEDARNIKASFSKGTKTIEIGDIVILETKVEKVPLFTLNSLNSWAYRSKVGYTLSASTNDLIIANGYTTFAEDTRQAIKNQIYDNMSEENAAIAYALMFGDDSGIKYEVNQSYRNSGIIHIIAVSGLNVAFLITLIYGFLKLCKVNRKVNFAITIIIILIYAYFCNFAPSIFRAAVMGVIIMTAKLCGRRYDALNSLGLAGFIILIVSPLTAFDVGFLMSVACVCGIVLLYSVFYKLLRKCMPRIIAQYIAVSFSAQLAILPFLASFSSTLNLLSFVINLFIVPLFAIMYPYLFVISFLCLAMPFLSFSYILVEWGLTLTYYFALIFSTTSLQVKLSPMSIGMTFFYFLVLYVLGEFLSLRPINKFMMCACMILCITLSFGFSKAESMINSGVLYLKSYGQEAVILVSSDGQSMLIGDNYIVSRAINSYSLEKLDYYISFDDLTAENVYDMQEYGISYFICLNGDTSKDDIHVVNMGQSMTAGDFNFTYVSYNDICLGVYVNFDQLSLFVASGEKIDYNDIDGCKIIINLFNPDIVFTGDNYLLADDNYISVSSKTNSLSSFNFEDDGNLLFLPQNVGYSVRRID